MVYISGDGIYSEGVGDLYSNGRRRVNLASCHAILVKMMELMKDGQI